MWHKKRLHLIFLYLINSRNAGAPQAVTAVEREVEDAVQVIAAAVAAAAATAGGLPQQAAKDEVLKQLHKAKAALGDQFGRAVAFCLLTF